MKIHDVRSGGFQHYGQILKGYDLESFVDVLKETPMPEDGFIYEPSVPELEEHPLFLAMRDHVYGGMPIQIGYCNGYNRKLNCLEYHKGSEVCIMAYDTVLLLGKQSEIICGQYDTNRIEAFLIPAGMGIELYATTLHYAPCNVKCGQGYKVANCLPRGTNIGMPDVEVKNIQNRMLWATNKWLLAHEESAEAGQGAYVGLCGRNRSIDE